MKIQVIFERNASEIHKGQVAYLMHVCANDDGVIIVQWNA